MDSNPRFPGHDEFSCRALPQGRLRGIRAPERTLQADQPTSPPGPTTEAKIERVMADPETIYNWRRLDDRITTSGQPTEPQLADIHALGVRHVVNLVAFLPLLLLFADVSTTYRRHRKPGGRSDTKRRRE